MRKNDAYRLTLPVYEFVRSEKRYAEMAKKGWLLERRGSVLEHYKKAEPEDRQYRMEFRPRKFLEGTLPMEEDELAVFADCGWEPVCRAGGVYVFSAVGEPEDAELYTDQESQLAFLKRSRNYLSGAGAVWGAFFGVWLSRLLIGRNHLLSAGGLFGGDWLFLLLMVLLLWLLWRSLYEAYRCRRLARLVKRGMPLRQAGSSGRFLGGKIVTWASAGLMAVCAVGSLALLLSIRTAPLPQPGADVPYVLLGEAFEGRRAETNMLGQPAQNTVRTVHGLLSDSYETEECFTTAGDDLYLDQKVYVLRFGKGGARALARALAESSPFGGKNWGGVREEEAPGFDCVLTGAYIRAAVKDNKVAFFMGTATELSGNWDRVLAALLEKWE